MLGGCDFRPVTQQLFMSRLRDMDISFQDFAAMFPKDEKSVAEFLLPKIIENTTDPQVMTYIFDWVRTLDDQKKLE